MKTKTANTLKRLLTAAVLLNMLVIVMQTYNTVSTISFAKRSLVLTADAALSTFEGGRRAMMALNPDFAPRFKAYLNSMGNSSGIKSIYLFDTTGKILLNTGNITPPVSSVGSRGTVQTEAGLFVYKTIIPKHLGMGFGGGMNSGSMNGPMNGQMGRGAMEHMMNMFPESDMKPMIAAALVDTAPLTAVKSSELSFLAAVIFLQLILGMVFFYAARSSKQQAEQTRELEMKEREAQMGRMSLVMAHELKNPLSSVKGLMEYSAKKSEGAQQDIAVRCVDELNRLDRIVNDFLTYGRDIVIEKGDTEIHSLAHDTAKLLEMDASYKNVTINITGGYSHIMADAAKMKQVLFNLLLNAIQASPEGSDIDVEIDPGKIRVINDFSEPVDTERIGTPFFTTKTVGTGLGIAIVRRILLLHGFGFSISADERFTAEITFS